MNFEKVFRLKCAACLWQQDLPENISLTRLNEMVKDFWREHKIASRASLPSYQKTPKCTKDRLYIQTFVAI